MMNATITTETDEIWRQPLKLWTRQLHGARHH